MNNKNEAHINSRKEFIRLCAKNSNILLCNKYENSTETK